MRFVAAMREADISRLGTLGGALGDNTRFSIYQHVVASSEPCSAADMAADFGLHRTVARAHLEKLVEAGLLQVGTRRKPGGGRPPKIYWPADGRLDIQLPARNYETLSLLLLRLAQRLNGQAFDMAKEIGWEYGRELAAGLPRAGRGDGRPDLEAVLRVLTDCGCSPRVVERTGSRLVLEVSNCLYREIAEIDPELVCGLSSGTICGLVGVDPKAHTQTHSMAQGHDVCLHEFVL